MNRFTLTFTAGPPTGARFNRRVDFRERGGKIIVSARTTWAMIDRASGRLVRVPDEVAEPFMPFDAIAGENP